MCLAQLQPNQLIPSPASMVANGSLTRTRRLLLHSLHPFINNRLLRLGRRDKEQRQLRKFRNGATVFSKRRKRNKDYDIGQGLDRRASLLAKRASEADGILRAINVLKATLARSVKQNETGQNVLDQLANEVESIKIGKTTNQTTDHAIKGCWTSEIAGGIFVLGKPTFTNGTKVKVKHRTSHDLHHDGFLSSSDWTTTLTIPFNCSSEYLILTAINRRDKRVATFMGQYKVCRKREIIQGNWLMAKHSRDCESRGASGQLIADVWRKDKVEELASKQKQHLEMLKKEKSHPHSKSIQEKIASEDSSKEVKEKESKSEPKKHEKLESHKKEDDSKENVGQKILHIFGKKKVKSD